jgi:hypothetical protein
MVKKNANADILSRLKFKENIKSNVNKRNKK